MRIEESDSPAKALKQTSAEPLDCSVRPADGSKRKISGERIPVRAAAPRRGCNLVRFTGSAAISSGERRLFSRSRDPEVVGHCRPSDVKRRRVISRRDTLFISEVFHLGVPPNKSPEPTLTVRPFSLTTAALEIPSSLGVSVAHL